MGKPRQKPVRLAEKLLSIRTALGLSQNEMIRRLGFEGQLIQAHISAYERRRENRVPPLGVVLQYARCAGVGMSARGRRPRVAEEIANQREEKGLEYLGHVLSERLTDLYSDRPMHLPFLKEAEYSRKPYFIAALSPLKCCATLAASVKVLERMLRHT